MLRLLLQFPAGRYHATPWGRHVNEGEVEWPPSPLRLCRALIAAGFNRLGWTEVPDAGRRLFEALSRTPPLFHLPPATAAHTRHYMPPFKGNTSKVLDAFACVGRGEGDVVGVTWEVDLAGPELSLLDALLGSLTYLGRAESWVEARRVEVLPEGLATCAPSEAAPGPGYERVPLLAALAPEAFASWREGALQREKEKTFGAEGTAAVKKAKAPSKKALAGIEALFPADIVTALCAETSALQKQGWNQPPGTRWVSYWRPDDALTTSPVEVRAARVRGSLADTALLALASDTRGREVLPSFTDAIRRLESLHEALVRHSAEASEGRGPSPCFTARTAEGARIEGHRHATLVPLSLDGRAGRLDHVLVHAPMGFDAAATAALRRLRRTWAKNLPDIYLTLVGLGARDDFSTTVAQLGASRGWRSVTPFVPPRFLKPRGVNSLEGQVRAELSSRGLLDTTTVEIEVEADPKWRHFRRERRDREKGPPITAAFGLRLSFAEPVRGPIALGYASHFGLGQFVPADGSIT